MLNSKSFRDELETIVQLQAEEGPTKQRETFRRADDVAREVATQSANQMTSRVKSTSPVTSLSRASCVVPVADLRGALALKYGKAERIARNKLASLYRLIDMYGWSDGIYGHSSVRGEGSMCVVVE